MNTFYPLDQSPFYRMESRQKLAKILWTSLRVLEQIANGGVAEYKLFSKKVGTKTRRIECPKGQLYKIASSLNRLLGKICVPSYVHSGVKGKSYHTNAKAHQTGVCVAKIDVKEFFPSASYKFVYECFLLTFQCSPDVAAVLTKLSTIKGHIPTGSPSSTIVSYYAYKPMFDEIDALAKSNGLTMSLCVDDITFSGAKSSGAFDFKVYQIVRKYGLRAHKRHLYEASQTKIVTGIALTPKGYRLPNKRRKKLHEALAAFHGAADGETKKHAARIVLGRSGEAAQLEPKTFKPLFEQIKPQAVKTIYH